MNRGPARPRGTAGFNLLFATYKNQANRRGIDFKLDKDLLREITSGNCYYCGIEPSQKSFSRDKRMLAKTVEHGAYFFNGIDRQDSSKGYVKGNCVPCCSDCNYMKKELSVTDFLEKIKKILKIHG